MPKKPREVVEAVDDLLTTADLVRGFGKTKLTIEKWRKELQLPYVRIRGRNQPAIRFRLEAVTTWAKANKKAFDKELVLK